MSTADEIEQFARTCLTDKGQECCAFSKPLLARVFPPRDGSESFDHSALERITEKNHWTYEVKRYEVILRKLEPALTEADLIKLAAAKGYQLVPIPEVIEHDLRPGDRVVHRLEPWQKAIASKADPEGKVFNIQDRPAVVLAVASRADVLARFEDTGKVVFFTAKGLLGEPTVVKIEGQE